MNGLIFPVALLILILVAFIIFIVLYNKKNKEDKGNQSDKRNVKKNENLNSKNVKSTSEKEKKVGYSKEDIFKFMEFDEIKDDMIVQNNGKRYTMVVKCKGINYDLMSEVEQMAVEEGFITFLNTLKYPIQLYVQAQNIDLKNAINKYRENIEVLKHDFEEVDAAYVKVANDFDSSDYEISKASDERNKVLNVYEYANDIIQYVERMSTNKNLLQRNFYILVSYNTSEIAAVDKFDKNEIMNICYTELLTRCQGIISALTSCSVGGNILTSNELGDLLYVAYNRDDKGLMSVKEALDSGYYRLYSVSDDVFKRRERIIKENIQIEAKVKALTAIKQTLENNTYETPTKRVLDREEKIVKNASDMIKRTEGIDQDIKQEANKLVLDEFKNEKRDLLKQIDSEKEEIKRQVEEDENEVKKQIANNPEISLNINNNSNNENSDSENASDNLSENVNNDELKNNDIYFDEDEIIK